MIFNIRKKQTILILSICLTITLLGVLTILNTGKNLKTSITSFQGPISGYFKRTFFPKGHSATLYYSGNPENKNQTIKSLTIYNALSKEAIYENLSPSGTPLKSQNCSNFKGILGCDYPNQVKVPTQNLTPGYYYVILSAGPGMDSPPIFFGIQPLQPKQSEVGVLFPSFTWQAYQDLGGGNLYHNDDNKKYSVSTLRPTPFHSYHGPEANLAYIKQLTRNQISSLSFDSLDLHEKTPLLKKVKVLLIGAHDEYWTQEMYEHLLMFMKNGGKVAVFGGNSFWWKVNYSQNGIHVCKGCSNPEDLYKKTGLWRAPDIAIPPEAVLGQSYYHAGYPIWRRVKIEDIAQANISKEQYQQARGMKVTQPSHPIYKSLSFKKGQTFGTDYNLMNVEVDGLPLLNDGQIDYEKAPQAPRQIKILAESFTYNAHLGESNNITRVSTIVEFEKHNTTIINLGSVGWWQAINENKKDSVQIFDNTIKYLLQK